MTSPITRKTGFVIVRDGVNERASTYVRAARADKPLGTGEVPVIRFDINLFTGAWIVSAARPSINAAEARAVRRWQKRVDADFQPKGTTNNGTK